MRPNIFHGYKYSIRQGALLDKVSSRNCLCHLAGTYDDTITIFESRVVRDPAQSDFDSLESLRLDLLIEFLHSFEQLIAAKHFLRRVAERMVVCEAGTGVVVVDQLAGEEACGKRPICLASVYLIKLS